MFTSLEGLLGPLVVQTVGEWVVDAVDGWVRDQGVIGRVGAWDAMCGGIILVLTNVMCEPNRRRTRQIRCIFFPTCFQYLGLVVVAGSNRDNIDGLHTLGRVNQGIRGNVGSSKDSDAESILLRGKDEKIKKVNGSSKYSIASRVYCCWNSDEGVQGPWKQ